jgi:hypothetical protein
MIQKGARAARHFTVLAHSVEDALIEELPAA